MTRVGIYTIYIPRDRLQRLIFQSKMTGMSALFVRLWFYNKSLESQVETIMLEINWNYQSGGYVNKVEVSWGIVSLGFARLPALLWNLSVHDSLPFKGF